MYTHTLFGSGKQHVWQNNVRHLLLQMLKAGQMATNRVKNRYIVLVQSPVSIIMIGLDGNMKKNLLIPLGALMWGALTASAYAQNCDNLDGNALWRQLFVEFNDQIKAGDNHAALKTTQKLQEICTRSPVLNYSIGQTHKERKRLIIPRLS